MSTIIAIGGDEVGVLNKKGLLPPVATIDIHREILARTGKNNPRVLYIPTAKGDSEEYIQGFTYFYKTLGCTNVTALRLIHEKPSKKDIVTIVDAVDVIYVNGGNTHRMMRIWKRRGLIDILKSAHKRGVVMAGHSAGAICWFSGGNSDSFSKRRFIKAKAMGIIDAILCPHFDTEKNRHASMKKMMKKTHRIVAITLDECAAIEITNDQYRVLPTTYSAKTHRAYWQKGQYYLEEIPQSLEFRDLPTLLTKPSTIH